MEHLFSSETTTSILFIICDKLCLDLAMAILHSAKQRVYALQIEALRSMHSVYGPQWLGGWFLLNAIHYLYLSTSTSPAALAMFVLVILIFLAQNCSATLGLCHVVITTPGLMCEFSLSVFSMPFPFPHLSHLIKGLILFSAWRS